MSALDSEATAGKSEGAEKEIADCGPPAPFERGQLVWAKLAGFPWWPSRVRRLEPVPAAGSGEVAGGAASWRARVRFCGTTFGDSRDFATISCGGTMIAFADMVDEWAGKMPYSGKSKMIRKQWKKAVDEARASPALDLEPDEEERAEAEAAAEEAAEAAAAAAAEAAVWAAGWLTHGHELIGARVARRFQGMGGGRSYLGTITRWLPPAAPAHPPPAALAGVEAHGPNRTAGPVTPGPPTAVPFTAVPFTDAPSTAIPPTAAPCIAAPCAAAPPTVVPAAGDVAMDASVDVPVDAFGDVSMDASGGVSGDMSMDASGPCGVDTSGVASGEDGLGVAGAVAGDVGVEVAEAAKVVGDEEVLFHVVMDDGDEEDLEQYEVDAAMALWRSTAEGVRALRAEATATDREWQLLERAARSAARKARGHDGVEAPMTAHEIYKRHVEALLGETSQAGVPEVSQFVLEDYSSLADEERLPFERRAARDRLRYQRERRLKRNRAARDKKVEKERAAEADRAEEESKDGHVKAGHVAGGEDGACNPDATPPASTLPSVAAPDGIFKEQDFVGAEEASRGVLAPAAAVCAPQAAAPSRTAAAAGALLLDKTAAVGQVRTGGGEAHTAGGEVQVAGGSEENPPVNLQRVGGAAGDDKPSAAKRMRVGNPA